MDECRWCFTHNSVMALYDMFMKGWAILRSNKLIVSLNTILMVRDACTISTKKNSICGVIKCEHHSTHLHFFIAISHDGAWLSSKMEFC
jgi:hypothetical protein